ncbi:MAG: T9SS type A sorting domain-containing protein [Bacteroidetes bacterium]|nr:T9SS type A sorting domain-containing protein [Bacteroidota bacterium]
MMKTVPLKKTFLSPRLLNGLAALGLVLCIQTSAGASPAGGNHPSGYDTIHSIEISKSLSSRKHKIRLYPDARQQVLFFSASGESGKVYQLFLFDMDGRLVSQTQIRNRETTVLTNISEGNFLFEVFTDDERIENGQVKVR